jgi:hypothetical protein
VSGLGNIGKYELRRQIVRGAMGVVYEEGREIAGTKVNQAGVGYYDQCRRLTPSSRGRIAPLHV